MDPISNIRPLAPIFNAEPDRRDTGLLPAYSMLSREGKLTGHVSALALVGIHASPAIIDDVLALQQQFQDAPDVKLVGIKILPRWCHRVSIPDRQVERALPQPSRLQRQGRFGQAAFQRADPHRGCPSTYRSLSCHRRSGRPRIPRCHRLCPGPQSGSPPAAQHHPSGGGEPGQHCPFQTTQCGRIDATLVGWEKRGDHPAA